MKFYITKDGVTVGPLTLEEIKTKLASGEVKSDDPCWREGSPDWQPLGQMKEFNDLLVPAPSTLTTPSSISLVRVPDAGVDPRPKVQCMDCGHIGFAIKKEYPAGLALAEFIWGAFLFLACVIPCFIYIAIVSAKKRKLAEMRYCEKCGSSAIRSV
jgi:hypothetical protein